MKTKFLLSVLILICACRSYAQISVMPYPDRLDMKEGKFRINPEFRVSCTRSNDTTLMKAAGRFLQTLNRRTASYFPQDRIRPGVNDNDAAMQVVTKSGAEFRIGLDESYTITVTSSRILLEAPNTIGALRGMETLLQLSGHDENGYFFPAVSVTDKPRYAWRGLMIDVARHFIPADVIRRNIDAMAAVKMNVLHLHLSDDEGFRIESKVWPRLHQMGSNGEYYTQMEMKSLVNYARERGILVIPEFDLPGHSRSWFAGYPELASLPGKYEPGPRFDIQGAMTLPEIMKMVNTAPTPSIDPSREYTYQFLDKLMGEMKTLFPSAYFHIGADENNGAAWKQNPSIVAFMQKNNIPDTKSMEQYFVKRIYALVRKHGYTMVGWEEMFHKDLPKDVIVQKWKPDGGMLGGGLPASNILQQGNPLIISSGFYIDHHMPAHVYYLNASIPKSDPVTPGPGQGLLGGEAAQWAEIADASNIEGRIWPGAAAIAERLWSPATVSDPDDMYRRLFILNGQLDENGLQHLSQYQRSLRRLAPHGDPEEVSGLVDLLTPVKGYKRIFVQMTSSKARTKQSAPLVQVADMVPLNSERKRIFRGWVRLYLKSGDTLAEKLIRNQLLDWKYEGERWNGYKNYPLLALVAPHATTLSALSATALEAMDSRKKGDLPSEWVTSKKEMVKRLSVAYGETELSVIPELEALITGKLLAEPVSFPLF